jgi:hypothetical protein
LLEEAFRTISSHFSIFISKRGKPSTILAGFCSIGAGGAGEGADGTGFFSCSYEFSFIAINCVALSNPGGLVSLVSVVLSIYFNTVLTVRFLCLVVSSPS